MSTTLNLATQLNTDGSIQANSITGPELANGSVTSRTINADVQTDVIAEGNVNFYFTNARAREAITVTGGGYYDNANGIITVGGPGLNTTNVIEGANLYFTNARARAAISAFDDSIIYNPATGEIRANITLLNGSNVISVNGQSGVVTLTAANITETASLQYFTNARARAALSPDSTLNYDESNGWLSIGQSVETSSNVQFNEVTTELLALSDSDGNVELEATIFYSSNANAMIVNAGFLPGEAEANVVDLGTQERRFRDVWSDTVNANAANFSNVVTATEFIGNFNGQMIQTITVTSDASSLVIGSDNNPPLFISKGGKAYFDVSSDTLIGIGFDIGDIATGELTLSNAVVGVSYQVDNANVDYENYLASFSASNTRVLVWDIPQSAPSTIRYYASQYTDWGSNILVAPPLSADELVEGLNNQFYTEQKLEAWMFSHADSNVGLSYDESSQLLTLAQDISPVAGPTFANVTANVMTANSFVGDLYGNIYGSIANLDPLTTDDLSEGPTNLYFTTERARQSINNGTGIEYLPLLGTVSLEAVVGGNTGTFGSGNTFVTMNVDSYGRVIDITNVDITLTTTDVAEGSNLYYTDERVVDALKNASVEDIFPKFHDTYDIGAHDRHWRDIFVNFVVFEGNLRVSSTFFDTANIAEANNLYYTDDRVWANVSGQFLSTESNITANIGALTTDDIAEGSANLYFTNSRARAAISVTGDGSYDENTGIITIDSAVDSVNGQTGTVVLTTSNIAEGSNLYYTETRANTAFDDRLGSKTTDNLTEGSTNLYYTDDRANTAFDARLAGKTTDNLTEGSTNLYYTNDRVWANVSGQFVSIDGQLGNVSGDLANLTTSNVVEGTNLYFTNTRARAAIAGGTGVTYVEANGEVNIGQAVDKTSDVEFKNIVITGNLLVQGTSITINASELGISDNMIYLNEAVQKSIANAVGDGANVVYTTTTDHTYPLGTVVRVTGITPSSLNQSSYTTILAVTSNTFTIAKTDTDVYVSGGNAYGKSSINPDLGWAGGYNDGTYHHAGVFRDATDGVFKVFENYGPEPDANIFIDTTHPTFSLARVASREFIGPVTGNVSDISNHTTTGLAEGSNLYFTNTRVRAAVGAVGSNLVYYEANGNFQVIVSDGGGSAVDSVNGQTGTVVLTTANIAESGNLYFTDDRVWANVGSNIGSLHQIIDTLSTTDVAEGTNLYFTNARVLATLLNAASNAAPAGFQKLYLKDGATNGVIFESPNAADYANITVQTSGGDTYLVFYVGDNAADKFKFYAPDVSGLEFNDNKVWHAGNDGDASGLDADLLDGQQGSYYVSNAYVANLTTTQIGEGSNLYFSNARARAAVGTANSQTLIYYESNGNFQAVVTGGGGAVDSVNGQTGVVVLDTDDISEGTTNLYFNNTRVRAAVGTAAANAKGLSYVEGTGEFSLATSGATAGNYGNATIVPQITVDSYGRITSVSNVAIQGGGGGAVDSVNGQTGVVVLDTDDISEGITNQYYTAERVWANVSGSLYTFRTFTVNGVSVVADAWNDTAAFANTTGIFIDGNSGTDTLTFSLSSNLQNFSSKTAPSGDVVGTSDSQTLTNKVVANATVTGAINEQVYALSGSSLNPDNGTIQSTTITGTTTFSDSFLSGQSLIIHIFDGNLYTVNWPTMTWVGSNGNQAPTLTNKSVVVFWKIGTTLYGSFVGSFV